MFNSRSRDDLQTSLLNDRYSVIEPGNGRDGDTISLARQSEFRIIGLVLDENFFSLCPRPWS